MDEILEQLERMQDEVELLVSNTQTLLDELRRIKTYLTDLPPWDE